ncbi:MAG: hypothetical protein HY744_01960 [Deltaproteobacteria bacterium]|nr:hypothetical protein [Deltaproteobacteria bacterium]
MDFVARWPAGKDELVQVCESLAEPEVKRRELGALEESLREGRARGATVVTLHEQGSVRLARRAVPVLPAWRWLLEGVA